MTLQLLVNKMRDEVQEHADMHGEGCPCNSDDANTCVCEEMVFWGAQIEKYMFEVNAMWVDNLKEHRKLCTKEGKKSLTSIKKALNK